MWLMQLFALIMCIRVNKSLEGLMKTSPPGDSFPSPRLANQNLNLGIHFAHFALLMCCADSPQRCNIVISLLSV